MSELKKRETAYKLRIEDILKSKQIFEPSEVLNKRLLFVELGNKRFLRVNLIANIIDKYESDGERKFASITLDDGTGQIRAKVFGEEINKFKELSQGHTVLIIGLLKSFNQELYIYPEIIKQKTPKYLLIRKLEIEKSFPIKLNSEQKKEINALRDDLIEIIKLSEKDQGIDSEEIIMKTKARPEIIHQEIKRLLEEGIIYEPRPGRIRYLG